MTSSEKYKISKAINREIEATRFISLSKSETSLSIATQSHVSSISSSASLPSFATNLTCLHILVNIYQVH